MILPKQAPKALARLVWLLLGIAVSDCSDSTGPAGMLPNVESVALEADSGSLFRTLKISLTRRTGVQVDYWAAAAPRLRVIQREPALEHAVFLPGLRAGEVYDYEVRTLDRAGSGPPLWSGQLTTDPLPEDLAAVNFTALGTPTHRLTMLELRNVPFAGFVIVDQDGAVVWFVRANAEGFTRRANGDFVLVDSLPGLTEIRPDLTVVARLPSMRDRQMHHDVIATPTNTLLFLAHDSRTFEGQTWLGDAIWEWNPEENSAVRRWTAWDFLSPDQDLGPASVPSDWLHANALALGPRGNVLISLPALNQVISIAAGFQSLEWRLGGPRATIVPNQTDDFWFQHTPSEIAPGRVLLFDNGRMRPGGLFSRALELKLDVKKGTAAKVWEFRPQPDIYAPILGTARRLENGNTFVNFGTPEGIAGASGPVSVYEVTADGRVTWRLRIAGDGLLNYRATPLDDIGGETVVQEGR